MPEYVMVPKDLNEAQSVFPAGAEVKDLMVPYDEIPQKYKEYNNRCETHKLVDKWFFSGLSKLEVKPREGIDKDKAFRHIRTIMQSWQCKHEHKTACIAFLLDHWFTDIEWVPNPE